MCFTFKKNNKQTKKPVNCFLQNRASAGIWSLWTPIVTKLCQNPGDRLYIPHPRPTIQNGKLLVCLSRAKEDTEGARPRLKTGMFIKSNVTVMKAKGTLIHLDHHIETESKLSIWLWTEI